MIDFRNLNTLWASVLVETLHLCGLEIAIICPGSRSTPLTVAFAQHQQITAIPVLDERSAAFFALGRSKASGKPTALVCTSGTAGANFYPAIIEAKESSIPLIVLTADRPPELRHCHAGQTIDQLKLYGNLPNWQAELALPEDSLSHLRYLRQNMINAWRQSQFPQPGVVHLNIPWREPLAPLTQPLSLKQLPANFFSGIITPTETTQGSVTLPWSQWQNQSGYQSGLIIAGLAQPPDPPAYCQAIAYLSRRLSFPVLGEALSPIRNYAALNPYLITTYDAILRHDYRAELRPEVVIQIGELPTSKQLRSWLEQENIARWVIAPQGDNLDPLHGSTIHLNTSIEQAVRELPQAIPEQPKPSSYCQKWLERESVTRRAMDQSLRDLQPMFEAKVAWLLSQYLPPQTPIFLANSMSIRHAEYFWQPNNRQIAPYFSRGANGIDGTLSTALGVVYRSQGVLLTGDLALLHDTNGFLIKPKFLGHLTIIVINNQGGGIFELLPIAPFPEFEEYFATPQAVDLSRLCAAYNVEHLQVARWQHLIELVSQLPTQGMRVLEVTCDRHRDANWLKENLAHFGGKLS